MKESVMKFWSIIIIVVVVDRQPTVRWRVYNLESWLSICAQRKSCSSLHLHHALIRLEIDFVYILKGFNGNLCLTKFKKFCAELPGIGGTERPSARIKKKDYVYYELNSFLSRKIERISLRKRIRT